MEQLTIQKTLPGADYELLDSGDGEKLERYADIILRRPDPQALWRKAETPIWKSADGTFTGDRDAAWSLSQSVPDRWPVTIGDLRFWIHPSAFKHTGVFPEQAPNWEWMTNLINKQKREIKVLNLFAYTGGATLACAKAGAQVVHVDGSRVAIKWARENAALNKLDAKPIRWITDDVMTFVKREVRRGNKYDAIILDPPAFGHGADGEVWKIETDFPVLISELKELLSDDPLFVLMNGYAAGYSALAYAANLRELLNFPPARGGTKGGGSEHAQHPWTIEAGELTIQPSHSPNLLPAGIFARASL